MASIFELEKPVFGRANETVGLVSPVGTANATLSAAETIDSLVVMTPTAARDVNTATAAAIVAELGDGVRVGTTFMLTLRNTAAATHALTLVGGSGVTLATGNTNTVAALNTRQFICRVTAIASGSQAVTIYSLPAGAH
jgi:hypothetical protein